MSKSLEGNDATVCVCCGDDYGDIAEECFVAGVCEDCRNTYSSEELIYKCLDT